MKIAILETNTGGELVRRLTSVPGGYDVVPLALTVATNRILQVLPGDIGNRPLLSCEGAQILAKQVCIKAQSDIGLAVIGEDDPNVGPYNKQTGNTYIGLFLPVQCDSQHIRLGGISNYARIRICSIVLDMLRRRLLQIDDTSINEKLTS